MPRTASSPAKQLAAPAKQQRIRRPFSSQKAKDRAEAYLRVGKGIAGKGVFARKRIPKKTVISEIPGTLIIDPDYGSNYCIDAGPGRSFEPFAPFRFLNHCCEPSASLFYYEGDGDVWPNDRPFLEALRTIREGEELFIDYCWDPSSAIPCLCGAPTCRGWIVDPARIDEIEQ